MESPSNLPYPSLFPYLAILDRFEEGAPTITGELLARQERYKTFPITYRQLKILDGNLGLDVKDDEKNAFFTAWVNEHAEAGGSTVKVREPKSADVLAWDL